MASSSSLRYFPNIRRCRFSLLSEMDREGGCRLVLGVFGEYTGELLSGSYSEGRCSNFFGVCLVGTDRFE